MNRKFILKICVLLTITTSLIGCSVFNQTSDAFKQDKTADEPVDTPSPTTKVITPASPKSTLSHEPETKNIVLTFGQQEDPVDYVSIPNHSSEITNKEAVNLPIGKATFLRFLHSGSAVVPTQDKVMYWLYVQKPTPDKPNSMNTYYMQAEVIGEDEEQAKKEFMQVAQFWTLGQVETKN